MRLSFPFHKCVLFSSLFPNKSRFAEAETEKRDYKDHEFVTKFSIRGGKHESNREECSQVACDILVIPARISPVPKGSKCLRL